MSPFEGMGYNTCALLFHLLFLHNIEHIHIDNYKKIKYIAIDEQKVITAYEFEYTNVMEGRAHRNPDELNEASTPLV